MIQIGCLLISVGMAYVGIQGLRGKPDSDGKKTNKAVAVACLILAVACAVFGFVVLPML